MQLDLDRRRVLAGAVLGTSMVAAPAALAQAGGSAVPMPLPTRDGKTTLTPDQALALLRDGNAAFLRGDPIRADFSPARRLELAKGQAPFVAYVSCSDSRVPPELLFGRGLGELFIIRNAGNTIDTVAMGSIEFAVAQLGVPLIIVMGHEACGAVKAAMAVVNENVHFPGAIGGMIEPIIPAVLAARGKPGDATENATRQNVRRTVNMLRKEADPVLLDPQRHGKVQVVGAYYALSSGRVDFFDLPQGGAA